MSARGEFLACLRSEGISDFISIGSKQRATSNNFNLTEIFEELSREEVKKVWEWVSKLVNRIIESQTHLVDEDCPAIEALRVATLLVATYIADTERKETSKLLEVAVTLHDTLLILRGAAGEALQSEIVKICETWWFQDRSGRVNLIPQTISYLVVKSLGDDSKLSDVKRAYNFREALLQLEWSHEETDNLRSLLLSALFHPMYLRCSEGIKFCTYLFGLHPNNIQSIHEVIKAQIPSSKPSVLEAYGEMYFRAWRAASGPYLQRIEYGCIQDLMRAAIYASTPRLAKNIRVILGVFTDNKKRGGVDTLLHDLYEPILWRALHVAHPAVRVNALTLLIDAFPIQKPEATVAETEASLQRQFDALSASLIDPAVPVRCTAAKGLCRLLAVFWELVPAPVLRALLNRLVLDLAFDASSPAVRAAVLEGLVFLLDNRLAHASLKVLLPNLGVLIDDSAERVRCALVELLLAVKRIREIPFWDIVPVEDLLNRMAIDSLRVTKQLSLLLLHTYFPVDQSPSVRLSRAVHLIRSNPQAAFAFFSTLCYHVGTTDVAELVVIVHRVVAGAMEAGSEPIDLSNIEYLLEDEPRPQPAKSTASGRSKGTKRRKGQADGDKENAPNGSGGSNRRTHGGGKEEEDDDAAGEGQSSTHKKARLASSAASAATYSSRTAEESSDPARLLYSSDSATMEGLLFSMAVLWDSLASSLSRPRNASIRRELESLFERTGLGSFLAAVPSPRGRMAVLSLASHLDSAIVPDVEASVTDYLKSLCSRPLVGQEDDDGLGPKEISEVAAATTHQTSHSGSSSSSSSRSRSRSRSALQNLLEEPSSLSGTSKSGNNHGNLNDHNANQEGEDSERPGLDDGQAAALLECLRAWNLTPTVTALITASTTAPPLEPLLRSTSQVAARDEAEEGGTGRSGKRIRKAVGAAQGSAFGLDSPAEEATAANKQKGKKKAVTFGAASPSPLASLTKLPPSLAFTLLDQLLLNSHARDTLYSTCNDTLSPLARSLASYVDVIDGLLGGRGGVTVEPSQLILGLRSYTRILLHQALASSPSSQKRAETTTAKNNKGNKAKKNGSRAPEEESSSATMVTTESSGGENASSQAGSGPWSLPTSLTALIDWTRSTLLPFLIMDPSSSATHSSTSPFTAATAPATTTTTITSTTTTTTSSNNNNNESDQQSEAVTSSSSTFTSSPSSASVEATTKASARKRKADQADLSGPSRAASSLATPTAVHLTALARDSIVVVLQAIVEASAIGYANDGLALALLEELVSAGSAPLTTAIMPLACRLLLSAGSRSPASSQLAAVTLLRLASKVDDDVNDESSLPLLAAVAGELVALWARCGVLIGHVDVWLDDLLKAYVNEAQGAPRTVLSRLGVALLDSVLREEGRACQLFQLLKERVAVWASATSSSADGELKAIRALYLGIKAHLAASKRDHSGSLARVNLALEELTGRLTASNETAFEGRRLHSELLATREGTGVGARGGLASLFDRGNVRTGGAVLDEGPVRAVTVVPPPVSVFAVALH